jgi:hypothetical protein
LQFRCTLWRRFPYQLNHKNYHCQQRYN